MARGAEAKIGGAAWVTLAAMTLSSSMILVDQTAVPLATPDVIAALNGDLSESQWVLTANVLPLAAFMVLGGRLGDLLGLRRIFLIGSLIFAVSTTFAGLAQSMPWLVAARAAQGTGAALMMPTAIAIVSASFPANRRGSALGILAGASAFFAALGPVLGGLLTSIDWRLVFLINVPLAAATVAMTLSATPRLTPDPNAERHIDYPGVLTFGLGIGAIVFALSQGAGGSFGGAEFVIPLVVGVVSLAAFVLIELRVANPLLEFRLFRHINFLAANISQVLAGAIELGLGFLLPFYLLVVVGISPPAAGIALIPATVPIILAGPLAGRAFDRVGGRAPLVVGFLVLGASGIALSAAASSESVGALIPGLVLQGFGLGIVLTVNDPTGLTAVPEKDRGQAAGMINTAEQLGGALGIAGLTAIEVSYYRDKLAEEFSKQGVNPTPHQVERFKELILNAEQTGLKNLLDNVRDTETIRVGVQDLINGHVASFELMFLVSAGIALLGALTCLILVRRGDRVAEGPIFSRRSRWAYMTSGRGPAITRKPIPDESGVKPAAAKRHEPG
jgi:EmrB/QacA subfamily drug resistance transporter